MRTQRVFDLELIALFAIIAVTLCLSLYASAYWHDEFESAQRIGSGEKRYIVIEMLRYMGNMEVYDDFFIYYEYQKYATFFMRLLMAWIVFMALTWLWIRKEKITSWVKSVMEGRLKE